jgi:hypothetical protein
LRKTHNSILFKIVNGDVDKLDANDYAIELGPSGPVVSLYMIAPLTPDCGRVDTLT